MALAIKRYLLPTPVSPVMRMLARVLAVFCISVHSRCMGALLNSRLVEVARVHQLGDLLGVVLQGVLHPAVVPLDGVDLLHGHGVEANGVFQLPVGVKQGNAHGHHVFVGVVDGLCGADLLPPPDDLRRNAGGERCRPPPDQRRTCQRDGVMGKTEVFLIGLADPQGGTVAVRDHHVIRQDQVVSGLRGSPEVPQIDPLVVESRKRRNRHRRRPPVPD